MAISIPVVRLRCSQQHITGVVNKSARLALRRNLVFSHRAVSLSDARRASTTLPLTPSRGAVFQFTRFHSERNSFFQKRSNCKKNSHRRRNICLHSNAGTVESRGRCARCEERSGKTRSGSGVGMERVLSAPSCYTLVFFPSFFFFFLEQTFTYLE